MTGRPPEAVAPVAEVTQWQNHYYYYYYYVIVIMYYDGETTGSGRPSGRSRRRWRRSSQGPAGTCIDNDNISIIIYSMHNHPFRNDSDPFPDDSDLSGTSDARIHSSRACERARPTSESSPVPHLQHGMCILGGDFSGASEVARAGLAKMAP